jgi:ribosomal protein L35AE/L33A
MIVLQIEHPVPDYDGWKKVFDSDPMGRKQSGVISYKILRQTDNPSNVIVELEMNSLDEAKNLLAKLQHLWKQIEGTVITGPKGRIIEMVEGRNC